VSQGELDGKHYALPLSADVSVLYWNKALFKAAGLAPDTGPKTWDEIRSTAAAITKTGNGNFGYFFSGGCGGCMAFTMLPYPWAQGAEVMVGEKANFAGNKALGDSLQLYRDIVKDGSTPNTAQTENGANQFGPFFSGKIGMFVNGTYPYVELKKSHPDIDFGIELVPSKDGSGAASFAGGDDIAITKRIDKATGMEVLKWFTSEGQQLLAQSGVLPIRSDIAQADYVSLDPRNQVFVDALKYGHIPKSPEVNAIFFDNSSPFAGLVQAGIFGTGPIDAALNAAQSAADKITGK
jgi:multiple sugar transport system substrate-binding protein